MTAEEVWPLGPHPTSFPHGPRDSRGWLRVCPGQEAVELVWVGHPVAEPQSTPHPQQVQRQDRSQLEFRACNSPLGCSP